MVKCARECRVETGLKPVSTIDERLPIKEIYDKLISYREK